MVHKDRLIVSDDPKSPISEAYRALRTNIQFANVDKQLKAIVITSSGQEEGKTMTIANLAITFAQTGSKTLLIDTDLRKPKLQKIFNLDNDRGLTNIITEHGTYKEYIQKTKIDNLEILTSGPIPPNPSELLASNSMKSFLTQLRNDYDMILLDSPPIGSVTDSAILSTISDGVILLVASGVVGIDIFKKSKETLERVNANIIGVVLNKVSISDKNYYYFYNNN